MSNSIQGIHHVTAIAGDKDANVRFYREMLGLRLVKQTVNFDNPEALHLYFGDYEGHPGTLLTFFYWARVKVGEVGSGQATAIRMGVPMGSLPFWEDRAAAMGVPTERKGARLLLRDPDGMAIELEEVEEERLSMKQANAETPEAYAIRRVVSVELPLTRRGESLAVMRDLLGFTEAGKVEDQERLRVGARDFVDIYEGQSLGVGRLGAGTIHHVAFRVADDATQLAMRERLIDAGIGVSPVMNRKYFKSIYFGEPSGVLFEIATDGPGFAVDEPVETLGEKLMMP